MYETIKEFKFEFFIILIIAAFVISCITFFYFEFVFFLIDPVEVECKLINMNYSPSTLQTHAVPIVNSNGKMSVAVATSGESEKYLTLWDCGEYGRLSTCDKKIFRYAREKEILLIKSNEYDTRIVGIVNR